MAKRKRHDGRRADELRAVKLTAGFVKSADGSCLIETGGTRVLCTASFVAGVPKWREESGRGWLTAEYAMLPASTPRRKARAMLKPDSRGVEIQRIIGRVLRTVVDFDKLGCNTIYLDCDVLEADGGTRTAAITGAYVALQQAVQAATEAGRCPKSVLTGRLAAVSVAIVEGKAMLDPDYAEDSAAEVDMNVAMTAGGKFVEIQGTGERAGFDAEQLDTMLTLARRGIRKLLRMQREAVGKTPARKKK